MRILDVRAQRGPNVFHSKPTLTMMVDLEDLAEVASDEIPGFNDRLISSLPSLKEHRCSPGYPGGFVERLNRGTYMAHIIEHVALDLSTPAGIEVGFGKSIYAGQPGHYRVIVRYLNEEAMSYLLRESVRIVELIARGQIVDVTPVIEEAKHIAQETALGPSSLAIIDAAEARNIPWRKLGSASLIQLGYGKNRHLVQTAVTDRTSLIATELVQDKEATKRLLSDAAIPVPEGFRANTEETIRECLQDYTAPFVAKPIDGHHGEGVTMDLQTVDDVIAACREIWKTGDTALIEEQCIGYDHRILVIGGKLVAAARRTPAHVIGDGETSIQELIDIANKDPRRGEGHGNVLTKIEVDENVITFLTKQNLALYSIPEKDRIVLLRQTANLSTGGTATDVTDEVHLEIRALCERVARLTGLDICGIDLITPDIRKPVSAGARVIEVNAGPGLRMHVAPSEGKSRDVGGAIVDMLYPRGTSARIPIISVTGTNGKTTVARLLAHIASVRGAFVGLSSSDGIMIGGHYVERGDNTGPLSARTVLSDPSVEFAVLETARGGLMRNGLGYDWSDVGIVTNIRPDHIGQDGIETLEDLVRVKSLIPERVRDGGTVVLNADDIESARVMETAGISRKRRQVVYISLDANSKLIQSHVQSGGTAYVEKEGWICELKGDKTSWVIPVRDLAFAFGGTARFHVSNALAATAGARAAGIEIEQIAQGLATFKGNLHNAGRSNIYRVGRGYVILDYAHNPDALAALGDMVKSWRAKKTTAVIGLPGDRANSLLEECTRAVAPRFDKLILRDDTDRRGRDIGEVPTLMKSVIDREFPKVEHSLVLDEATAIEHVITGLADDELAIVFYDDFERATAALRKFDPVPLDSFPWQSAIPKEERNSGQAAVRHQARAHH